jgi:hypothetical protein
LTFGNSWYKNNKPEGKLQIWGGSVCEYPAFNKAMLTGSQALHYIKSLEFVRWEHYNFRYHAQNPWAFLGDGRVKAEFAKEKDRLTPYIRNSDEPWHIE